MGSWGESTLTYHHVIFKSLILMTFFARKGPKGPKNCKMSYKVSNIEAPIHMKCISLFVLIRLQPKRRKR